MNMTAPKETRNTRQRNLILDCLKEHCDSHMTVDEIFALLKDKGHDVGIATVYRNLKSLEDQGLIEKVYISGGAAPCYKMLDETAGNKHTHHHMICRNCGAIADFDEDLLDAIEKIVLVTKDFTVTDHRLSFYGVCGKCSKK